MMRLWISVRDAAEAQVRGRTVRGILTTGRTPVSVAVRLRREKNVFTIMHVNKLKKSLFQGSSSPISTNTFPLLFNDF